MTLIGESETPMVILLAQHPIIIIVYASTSLFLDLLLGVNFHIAVFSWKRNTDVKLKRDRKYESLDKQLQCLEI